MRKLTQKQRLYLLYKAKKAHKKKVQKNREKRCVHQARFNDTQQAYDVWCPVEIKLLGKHAYETFDFIQSIKDTANKYGRVRLLMQRVRRINADGMVLLLAEITALKHHNIKLRIIQPKAIKERAVLKHTGFLELFGATCKVDTSNFDSVSRWLVKSGKGKVNGEELDITHLMQQSHAQQSNLPDLSGKTFSFKMNNGIIEAISNTMSHAYVGERQGGFSLSENHTKWWAFSCYNHADKTFTLLTVDLGIGMARSTDEVYEEYRKAHGLTLWASAKQILRGKKDHDIIQILAEGSKKLSCTELPHRGLGLETNILKPAKEFDNVDVAIYSNRGYYSRFNTETETKELPRAVNGTIIAWIIRLG